MSTKVTFTQSLEFQNPPTDLTELQTALWYAAKNNWEQAHQIAQNHEGEKNFDHLHAYLHRIEGDEWNAGYWYRRAGESFPDKSINEELTDLIRKWC
ncbi:MAG: hypothetical protein E6Q58_05225 [Niabella sp.]|nr:MAG: hypothetical protein E6Q58_05225 [Niabella sp.]